MPFRLLARATPLVLGAVAAGVWLRRRQPPPLAIREETGELPPVVPPEVEPRVRAARRPRRRVDIVTIVEDLLGATR